ncbi:DUF397 domain-containing protein [Streptomyces sp. OfavH-34-F]|nr:DUF397 domain-containing protein [Streptomyces sp. OfavH-34-F]
MYSNGIPATSIQDVEWFKASASDGIGGNCIEVAALPEGHVAFRNSRDKDGPALVFTPGEWAAFSDGMKGGEFDRVTV